jgi:hypothetical protein
MNTVVDQLIRSDLDHMGGLDALFGNLGAVV